MERVTEFPGIGVRAGAAIDRRELVSKALAGLIGGALGWIPVEITSHGHGLTEAATTWSQIGGLVALAMMAGMIGGMINAAASGSFNAGSANRRRFLKGFLICLAISIPGTYYSNALFNSILSAGGWGYDHPGSMTYLFVGRVVGWCLMGLMVGIGAALANFSIANVTKGALGGLVGGLVGGVLFDPIGSLSQTGLVSRLLGFSVLGLAIGLFIGLVQELTKTAWLVVEAGRLRGRQFRLDANTITVGRAEENAVGLFGDQTVAPRHAVIEHRGQHYTVRNLAVQAGVFVNGARVESSELHDGDRVQIGGYELRFRSIVETRRPEANQAPPPAAVAGTPTSPSTSNAATVPCLIRSDGERLNLRVGAATRIGRALDNDLVLNDASVS